MTTPPNGSPFAQPSAGGDKFEPKDYMGALLMVFPKSYNPNAATKFGPSTSADCDIVVVDRQGPDGKPVFLANARLFGNLANSVRDSIGSQVLGRIGQVPTNQGNPAWVLNDYTDADVAMAMPALQAYQAGQFKAAAPAQQQPPAAHDPWAGMNVSQTPPQQQYAPPAPGVGTAAPQAAPGAPAAAPGGNADPNVALLIGKGLNPQQVLAMDPATRAAVAASI